MDGHESGGIKTWEGCMNVTQEKREGAVILHMEGRFDFGSRKTFKESMDEAIQEGMPVILDLGQITFVDSSALGLLVISHQNLKIKKIPFYLVNPQTYVRQVLDLANVAKMIPIYQTFHEIPKWHPVASGAPV
jgi:HptB-dependent secretion and biofilm anti anti-sigma factor